MLLGPLWAYWHLAGAVPLGRMGWGWGWSAPVGRWRVGLRPWGQVAPPQAAPRFGIFPAPSWGAAVHCCRYHQLCWWWGPTTVHGPGSDGCAGGFPFGGGGRGVPGLPLCPWLLMHPYGDPPGSAVAEFRSGVRRACMGSPYGLGGAWGCRLGRLAVGPLGGHPWLVSLGRGRWCRLRSVVRRWRGSASRFGVAGGVWGTPAPPHSLCRRVRWPCRCGRWPPVSAGTRYAAMCSLPVR